MRALICNTYLYRRGGAETYTLALADLLRSRGHDVALFGMRHPDNVPSEQHEYFVDYIDYPTLPRTLANGMRVVARSIYYPEAKRRLRALIEDWRPDVIHLQNIHAHLTPSVISAGRAAGVPIVWTLHDFKLICPENSFFSNGRICDECRGGRFYRCAVNRCKKGSFAASAVAAAEAYVHNAFDLVRRVDRCIAPSAFLKRRFEEFGWHEPRIDLVRNFLPDLGRASIGGRGYGVFTGMLRPVKGVATLLDALKIAGDPPFLIAGDGPARAELEAQAQRLALANTRFLGHLGAGELEPLVRDADYAVVPSEWYENCPYAVLEAMAAGKAVVASDHGGLTELVAHGETGLLFEPKNAAALAAMLRRLAADPALGRRLGAAARAAAEREFTADAHYLHLSAVYADVLEARRGASREAGAAVSAL